MSSIIPVVISVAAVAVSLGMIWSVRATKLIYAFADANWALAAAYRELEAAYRSGADPASTKAKVAEAKAAVERAKARLPKRTAAEIAEKARKP